MKRILNAGLMLALLSSAAVAQQKDDDHAAHHGAAPPAAAVALTDGEVRRVDRDAKKVTLRHAEIRSLDMPPMTMVFQVRDAALLDQLKVGDKIRFTAEKVGGAYLLTRVEMSR